MRDTIQGYALVLVWRVFGGELPDFYDCPRHGRIDLRLYNVPAGELPDFSKAVA